MPSRLGVEGSVCLLPYYLSSSPLRAMAPGHGIRMQGRYRGRSPAGSGRRSALSAAGPCRLVGQGEGRQRWATNSDGRRHIPCAGAGSRGHAAATTRTVWQQSVPLKRRAFGAQSPGCSRAMKGSHPRPQAAGGAKAKLPIAPGVAPRPSEVDIGQGGAGNR